MSTFGNFRESGLSLPDKTPSLPFLILLLTGDADATFEALISEAEINDPELSFFDLWITSCERGPVINRALRSMHSEIKRSIARYDRSPRNDQDGAKPGSLPPPSWCVDQEVTEAQLQRALLAIDIFPRCVLILTMYEGMVLGEVAALLRTGKSLMQRAQVDALIELTRNIAVEQGWPPGEDCDRASAAPAFRLRVDDLWRSDTLRHQR